MAYSLTELKKSVHGDERVFHGVVVADATSGGVAIPGVNLVTAVHLTSKSSVAGLATVLANYTKSAIAANGSVQIKSATSGDEYYITVFGR